DYERTAAVDSARLSALGKHFSGASNGREADAARWSAVGAYYAPDYEHIAAVNSARWTALGEWYTAHYAQVH
ncbi:MAG: hypothetical protein M8467_14695, partial [Anaerolineae bacterium]|nr:hypothetical protein [Anaerolineae bacterium]